MNNFKQKLKVHNSKNVDKEVCNKVTLEMKKLCKKINLEENEESSEEKKIKIEQIEKRIRGISKIFINYQRNMDNIRENEFKNEFLKRNAKHEISEIDKELQKIVNDAENEIYKIINREEDKIQVADRIEGIKEVLENFDEDISFIYKLEMQQTKMGSLIFEEEQII